jgi:FAD dependent oxidoreductase
MKSIVCQKNISLMERRNFLGACATVAGTLVAGELSATEKLPHFSPLGNAGSLEADLVIAGGGLGGIATALGALRNGLSVIMTEETDWIGGQITSQGVPPDEHPWIETHGAPPSYRAFREGVRTYYKSHYPLTDIAKSKPNLNPGDGAVSRICHEPRVALAVLHGMLAPYVSAGKLTILTGYRPAKALKEINQIKSVTFTHLLSGANITLSATLFADATELGDLLPITDTAYRTGTESKNETGEWHAPEKGNSNNNQAFTMCFAMDYLPGEHHVIEEPRDYNFWRNHIPPLTPAWSGKLLDLNYSSPSTLQPKALGFHPEGVSTGDKLNLWNYRRLINRNNFTPGFFPGDISLVNWPQNDYMLGNIVDVSQKEFDTHLNRAKQLSLSLLYWLQTEAPRPDGGKGWPGLRLRKDIMGTADGLAKYPYVRESRRIKALFTITEAHVGKEQSAANQAPKCNGGAVAFDDSVGIGYYHIDLHPSSNGDNYIDFPSVPFQIPLGALIPVDTENLLPACKNIGTTHITNGCYRLHPVEWSIGEAVGCLAAFAKQKSLKPRDVRENNTHLREFQAFIRSQGIETDWPTKP